MKNIVIDGNNFSDLEGFYTEIDKLLTKNLTWKTGHNLNAFNDLLRGGFGVHEYEEELHIKWIHFAKSRQDLGYCVVGDHKDGKGETMLDVIIEIILDSDNSGHFCELEIEE